MLKVFDKQIQHYQSFHISNIEFAAGEDTLQTEKIEEELKEGNIETEEDLSDSSRSFENVISSDNNDSSLPFMSGWLRKKQSKQFNTWKPKYCLVGKKKFQYFADSSMKKTGGIFDFERLDCIIYSEDPRDKKGRSQ